MAQFTVSDFDKALQDGPYAWPGGYPRYFICNDGEALSFKAAQENAELIRCAIANNSRDGWQVVACDVNWEDEELQCAHSNARIECAYPSDAHWDRFDICEAYAVLEADYNVGGWLQERPSNQRRRESCAVQLHRMNFKARPSLDGRYANLSPNGQKIYDAAVSRLKLPKGDA